MNAEPAEDRGTMALAAHGFSPLCGEILGERRSMRGSRFGATLLVLAMLVGSFALVGHTSAQVGADLNVTIKASKHVVQPGRTITFTITATNVGEAAAQNVVVSGWLPDWFNYVASGCSSDTYATQLGALDCAVGAPPSTLVDLAPGQSVTLTLVLTTFNNPRQDRNNAYELGWVTWGPDGAESYAEAEAKVQIAGRPAEAGRH
jgi:uncharacterized repeat protein (TIGR01451 family)